MTTTEGPEASDGPITTGPRTVLRLFALIGPYYNLQRVPDETSMSVLDSGPALPVRRDWIDLTIRLATSWVGLFIAYASALVLSVAKFKELNDGLKGMGVPPWLVVILIAAFPLLAICFSTIPSFIEQHRIRRYSEIRGPLQPGYFTLRPRENEADFERADNAHKDVLGWIENSKEPVLYLTGASGTGKSSLLSAWVIPKLKRDNHVVIQVRGYQDVCEKIKEEILKPGVIWDRAPSKTEDLRFLLDRACQRLDGRRLLIVVDQFEEFLILKEEDKKQSFRQLLSGTPVQGLIFLLVFRPEYEGFIQDESWPKLQLENRRVISPFTENAAQEFVRKSGLIVAADLMRAVLHEATEIEQGTVGLIRPVTINLCGLVLSRFAGGLPRRFRGGILRGFLRESLSLPEVRDVAPKLIPQLVTTNVTKRARTITELAKVTRLAPASVRACLFRLGESDRAIVRALDQQQESWEISHDFLVPLLDAIVARRTVSLWRRFRPWLPWTATAFIGIGAVAIPLTTHRDDRASLIEQGWLVSEEKGVLRLRRSDGLFPPESVSILRRWPKQFWLNLPITKVTDVSALRDLKNLTTLDLRATKVTDISALAGLKNLTTLQLAGTGVTDVSALRDLKNLTTLELGNTNVMDVSALRGLMNLTTLELNQTKVTDVSALRGLMNLTTLWLTGTKVTDVSALRGLMNLTTLQLGDTKVTDVSALGDLKNLTTLQLGDTNVMDVSALGGLKNLTTLDLSQTEVTDVSALGGLMNLTTLDLSQTKVMDVSALGDLKSLTTLDLRGTRVTDVSALRDLKNLTIVRK